MKKPRTAAASQKTPLPPPDPPKPSVTRILLVDDHPVMRQGMKVLIEQRPHFAVCAEADSAAQALELAAKLAPNLAVIDITLKSTNGIELTKDLRIRLPEMRILVVSMHEEEVYAERALRAGAMGYLMKLEAPTKVTEAIDCLLRGEIYLSEKLKDRMLHQLVHPRSTAAVSPIKKLSDREMEVFRLIGTGYGTREIANLLHLSVKTIDSYRENLKTKLSLPTGGGLVRHAIQWMKSQAA